jgi:hypothetical protein
VIDGEKEERSGRRITLPHREGSKPGQGPGLEGLAETAEMEQQQLEGKVDSSPGHGEKERIGGKAEMGPGRSGRAGSRLDLRMRLGMLTWARVGLS